MLALTVGDQRSPSARPVMVVDTDAITSLLDRVRRLVDAECVIGLYSNPDNRKADVFATIGQAKDIDSLKIAILGLLQHLEGSADTRRENFNCVEVSRFLLNSEHGEVLAIEVEIKDASLVLVATRAPEKVPFTINDERAVRRMSDWISDYVQLWWLQRRDRQWVDSLHSALDHLGVAIFLLDGRGKLIISNRAGCLLLEAGDGLRKVGGKLAAINLDDSVRLQTAIAHASLCELAATDRGPQQAPTFLVRRKSLRPLSVAVMPSGPAGKFRCGGENFVIVHAVDPHGDIERSLLSACALYGLTSSEIRLVKLLVSGEKLEQAAARLHIQPPTARTYLKQIFAKTGTNRQAALVGLLLTSIVRTGPDIELTALQ